MPAQGVIPAGELLGQLEFQTDGTAVENASVVVVACVEKRTLARETLSLVVLTTPQLDFDRSLTLCRAFGEA